MFKVEGVPIEDIGKASVREEALGTMIPAAKKCRKSGVRNRKPKKYEGQEVPNNTADRVRLLFEQFEHRLIVLESKIERIEDRVGLRF